MHTPTRSGEGSRRRTIGSPTRAARPAVTALALSSALVACSAGGATMPMDGAAANVASIVVSPDTLSTSPFVFATHRPRLTALLKDSAGQPLDGIAVRWSSTDTSVATITPGGTIVARRFGEANFTATAGRSLGAGHMSVRTSGDTDLVVIAHRGFAGVFPENTLVAVKGAYDLGADAVEIDVRLSRDGIPIVIHDATVDRTTSGTGAVGSLTARELQQLDACSKFGSRWGSCPVPTLEDALQMARGRGRLLLHIQDGFPVAALPRVLELVHSAQLDDQVVFICFDGALLRAIRALDPGVSLGFLLRTVPPMDSVLQLRSAAILIRFDSLLAQSGAGREFVQRAKAAGVDVGAWTLWSQDQGRALLAAGNVRLVTDYPLDKKQLR